MSQKLKNQVAWVSGGTSGIGEAVCELFAREGAKIVITGRNAERGRAVVAKIEALGGEAAFYEGCISKEATVAGSIALAEERFGRLDILINNAGMVEVKMLHDYSAEEWDFLMDVNVKSSFLSLKYAFPLLRRNERSYIVMNGSISSFVGQAMTPAYTTSKGAMLQLCKSIALDYAAWGVRCNIVCPGITDTPMLREHIDKTPEPDETLRQRLRRVCLGIPLYPADVAKSFLYFACEDSVGITGTSLVVDAGFLAAAEWDTESFKKMAKV
jgi:NAD(P)-dependent dehydrogenase (short-subunit alcohol dehydrogenase family)